MHNAIPCAAAHEGKLSSRSAEQNHSVNATLIPKNEVGLPLVDAVEAETGRRPHLCTVLRWSQKRNRYGIKLETWMLGGRRCTSREAVRRFNEATTAAANKTLASSTTVQRSKAHSDAKRELARLFAE
jgi:hypothetical protein